MEWLNRFVTIMDFVCESTAAGVSLTELVQATGLSKGTLHRILRDMVDQNLVMQDTDTKKYCLGPKAMVWGSKFVLGQDPARLLSRYCDLLAEKTSLYTFLCRISEGEVYCIYTRQPSKVSKKYFVHVGQRMPVHCTAAAKSILAFLPDNQVRLIMARGNMEKFTDHTKTDISSLIGELRAVNQTGVAFCREEIETGVSAISAPVFVDNKKAVYSISLLSDAAFLKQQETNLVREIIQIGQQASEHMKRAQVLTSV